MATGRRNPEFSWSISRDRVFRLCPRRYYYEYYGSWGGWRDDATPLARELAILKNLKTRPLWIGDLVHRAIERSLNNLWRGVAVLPVDRIVEITLNLMRNEYRASLRGGYRRRRGFGLFEHEYEINAPASYWQEAARMVEAALRTFYASDIFAGLRKLNPDLFLEVERLSFFNLENTRCWVVLDVAYRESDGITIADWKTGKAASGSYDLQMVGYALYAAQRWDLPINAIRSLEYNLSRNEIFTHRTDEGAVARTVSFIIGSIADMRSLLAEAGENIPLAEERFRKVERSEACVYCPFFKICVPAVPQPRSAWDIALDL